MVLLHSKKNLKLKQISKFSQTDLIVGIVKVVIIVFTAVFLIGSIMPFYNFDSPYFNAIMSINLSNGIYSFTNELLQETGRDEFVGNNWAKTEQNDIVPRQGPRISLIGSLFYGIGGYYGLLYLTPIFGILLLIFSERLATNLFGKYVGLLTLLFLATSNLLFRNAIRLQSDVVFSVFVVLGCFFIIRFLKGRKDWNLLAASSIFVFAAILRINGIMFFPAEILIVGGYFLIKTVLENRGSNYPRLIFAKMFRIKAAKCIIFLFLPWLFFVAGYGMYHDHFFGDPFTNYLKIDESYIVYESDLSSLVGFELQDFENSKAYSKYLLPYQFAAIHNKLDNNYDDILGDNWPGIILQLLLFSILLLSLYTKKKRTEIFVLMLLIIANLWFYSAITTSERASHGVAGRFMIPVFTFSAMMISYLIIRGFDGLNLKQNLSRLIKPTLGVIIGIFFLGSFYFLPSVQTMFSDEPNFSDPRKLMEQYPLDAEGLTNKSVIVSGHGERVLDYGAIPFKVTTEDDGRVISLESIDLLKQTIEDGYDVFVFKQVINEVEKNTTKELRNNYGIALKDYSPSFCKIQVISTTNATSSSDKVCYELEPTKSIN